jgi:Cu(I)/Ag(I) efflux system membrane protein CusA/SilA
VIERVIGWALGNRLWVGCLAVLLVALGIRAVRDTPVDALPDLSENQVLVAAEWAGRGPQEVEDQVTYPLSVNLQGLGGVRAVRAGSMFGFSLVTVVFEDGIGSDLARQRVLERLSFLRGSLPEGVEVRLGPDATGLGWVYQYYLDPGGSGSDLGALRALQDWTIRYQLSAVPGVAEVASVGGFVRQYQVEVSPQKLQTLGLSLDRVLEAVRRSNMNVGGKTVEENGMEFVVRGVGLVRGVADLESVVVEERGGVPICVRDVARVELGGEYRRGVLDVGGREVVGGMVVMRTGENAREVIRRVKAKLDVIRTSLPRGVEIRPFYDRSELIERTIGTLRGALIEEILLVTVAHIVFLAHFRSILVVTLPLPLSILGAFLLMRPLGVGSNLMSLSGIAIAIGVLVDAGIVLTENVLRRMEEGGGPAGPGSHLERIREASVQVGRPVFFSIAIILLAFLPVFALEGREGKLFHPLAFTKTLAMGVSGVLALTLVPVLCTVLVRGPYRGESGNWVMRGLQNLYEPVLDFALRRSGLLMSGAALLLAGALAVGLGLPEGVKRILPGGRAGIFEGLGSEFMPALDEGSLLFMPTFAPAAAMSEVKRVMAWQDTVLSEVPEVQTVAGKLGRADTATDPAPTEMIETTIQLKPHREWRPGMTREKLVAELTEKMRQVPGSVPGFLQPIENRILMTSTGIRAQLGVKLLGADLGVLQAQALEVERVLKQVPGAVGVVAGRTQSKPFLEIDVEREALGRYGLRVADVLEVVEVGLGGRTVGTFVSGRERYPIQVRFDRGEREDLTRIRDILVSLPGGGTVPLGQVAQIRRVDGPSEIQSENGRLRVAVQANVQGRDLGGFVEEVKARLAREVAPRLPEGVTLEYSGEFENALRAERRLQQIVPVVLLIILLLLYQVYGDVREALHVLLAVPFALSGGVFFQALLGYPFSVAVWVGYIALFGTAIQTGVVMVVYLDEAVAARRREKGASLSYEDLLAAVKDGARLRLRPKVMTVATIVASLLPIFWSTRPGSEVMRPLAAPVLGGMLSSLVHILLLTPAIFLWLRARDLRRKVTPE